MNRIRIVADSSCDLITLDEVSFVSVPLTIRTETQEFRDDASLDVETMVDIQRAICWGFIMAENLSDQRTAPSSQKE